MTDKTVILVAPFDASASEYIAAERDSSFALTQAEYEGTNDV